MKLNFYQAWHFHYIAKIKRPFKLWIKEKKQGKMKFFGEVMKNGIYDVPEADDNKAFKEWISYERRIEMNDNNGIEVKCMNCAFYNGEFCDIRETFPECHKRDYFLPTEEAYIARIAELQKELTVIQASERAEAQEADRLRAEVKDLEKKLTETFQATFGKVEGVREAGSGSQYIERRINYGTQKIRKND